MSDRPLTDVRIVELAGLGPAPHAAMILADLGADVLRVEPPGGQQWTLVDSATPDPTLRGKRRVVADLKSPAARDQVLELVSNADVLIEGFRPGVAERLGLGPSECRARNARLVYGRMTGWGQDGPLSKEAGHDINYIALTGALHAIGTDETPIPPLNLLGDFGGGSMLLVIGIVTALYERHRSGSGQVIDAAMVDGVSLLMQMIFWMRSHGMWSDRRSSNSLDGGKATYRTYRCADGGFVAVGCLEPQFYAALLAGLQLDPATLPPRESAGSTPVLSKAIADAFAQHPREHWVRVFAGTDACVTPVLSLDEVGSHPHIAERRTVVTVGAGLQAAPAPRFSRTRTDEVASVNPTRYELADVQAEWSGVVSRTP